MRNQSFLLCQKSSHSSLDYQKTTKNMESHHRKPTGQISFPRLKTSLAFMRELTIFPFSAKHMSLTKYGWCPRASHLALCTSSATEWRLGPPHSLGRKREQYWGPIPTPPNNVQPLGSLCFSVLVLVHSSNAWDSPSSLPPPASFPTFLQNRNYFAYFFSKSKNRKEKGTANLVQLVLLLLNKDFFCSDSLSGCPSHLHSLLLSLPSTPPTQGDHLFLSCWYSVCWRDSLSAVPRPCWDVYLFPCAHCGPLTAFCEFQHISLQVMSWHSGLTFSLFEKFGG